MGLNVVAAPRVVARSAPQPPTRPQLPRSVSVLIGVLLAVAAMIDGTVLHLHPTSDIGSAGGSRLALAIAAFAIAETIVLHVELGRNAHTISLAELPLTIALFFLPFGALPVARLLGGGFVLLVVRRQRPVKALFNASVWLVDVAAATAVFQWMHGGFATGNVIVPAVAAAVTAAAADSLAVNIVIALTSGEMHPLPALRFLYTCVVGALAAAMFGIICVGALHDSPWLLVPIVVVAGSVLVGFRAFGMLHRRHTNVKVLYDFTDQLARTPYGDAVVHTVLTRLVDLLRVERAELWLDTGDGHLQVSGLQRGGSPTDERVPEAEAPGLVLQVLGGDSPVVVRPGEQRRAAVEFLAARHARDAALVSLDTQQGLRAVLLVADRLGDVTSFSADDARLLQALAAHAAAALVNSQLLLQLNHDSTHDALTGLVNRAQFQQQLDARLQSRSSTSVLLMDLDRFKEVNDTLGHHYGDLLLQEIATRLSRQLRPSDLLARLGGDEFAVLITGGTLASAVVTAQRLREALAEPMRLEGVNVEVNASIGIAHAAPIVDVRNAVTATSMLQRADVAMYSAKQDGTGVSVYQQDLDEHSPRRLTLAGGLRAAIECGELSLRYQPQLSLAEDRIVGVEALVRWDHPAYGEVPPDEFIGVAEQTGQIRELTRYVLDEAVHQCGIWMRAGQQLAMSINISVRNLLETDLSHAIAEALERHQVPSNLLTLEITESQLMADASRTRRVLGDIADLGVRLSVDDFGTGYSSLAYLKQMPVSEIKIDKSFVRDLATDANDAAIVEAIVQLAHTLNVDVVGEGVEDEQAEAILRQLGCDVVQGYHLARPMHASQMSRWLRDQRVERRPQPIRVVPRQRAPRAAGAASR